MLSYTLNTDLYLTSVISHLLPHNHFFDLFFSFFSQNGGSILIWITLIILILIFEEKKNPGVSKKDKQFIIIFVLTLLTQALLVNIVLKNVFQRPRPFPQLTINNQQLTINNSCPTDFSFPSGHTATAFCAAAILIAFDKKRKYLYYSIAFTIALSRIYLSCHYLGDVLMGGLIGWLIASFFLRLQKHL